MFGGFSRHFRHVIKSKSDEARAKQQARLIAMPSRYFPFLHLIIYNFVYVLLHGE